ncbi:rod shape-determining protein [Acetivibrio sp. MSJd-27]|jgi:cell division protein ftsA|uniref:rod shape-determining protein n=1 Tax=Acetivibrio sp. MSJd-27 TaxID=2841523 RepID=UPI001C0FC869|nr:rod shape-determining protein MreB [Acetivibrio sp. MSJd-27]MBU5450506.1 rod shape-determining protein MreB [Acetivibrio sp. MSJd-27]
MFHFRQDIGIDLGTATVIIYSKGSGIVLREPSVAAIDKMSGNVYAVGVDAQRMLGRTPSNIVAIRPLRDGVISDYDTTEKMLKQFLNKVNFSKFFKPNIVICVPSGVTEVEERAVIDVALQAGAKKAYVIEEPIAAAIGAGIDISQPMGNMIVDIGGGTTDIAVISLGGVVASSSIKVAGDTFDDAIVKYVKKKYNVLIGERTAEEIKTTVGSVVDTGEEIKIEVRGRNLMTGLPKKIEITSKETVEVLQETAVLITDAIHSVVEKTPPELVGDIYSNSIVLTGGGALMRGMTELIEQKTGIHAVIAEDPTSCVAIGTGLSLEQTDVLQNSFGSVAERKNFE